MAVPAGWYDDGSGRQRWWDGEKWTENYAPVDGEASAAGSATAGQDDIDLTVRRDDEPADAFAAPVANPYAPPQSFGQDAAQTAVYPGATGASTGAAYGATPAYGSAPRDPKKPTVLAWIAMGVALLGLLLSWIPFVGVVLPIIGLVLSIIALIMKGGKWPGIVGLIASIIGLIVSILIIIGLAIFAQEVNREIDRQLTDRPTSSTSEEPGDGGPVSAGRPTPAEVEAGLREIVETVGDETFTDEQFACYAEFFVDSDIPDETLAVIANGDEAITDADAAQAFTSKLTEGMTTCLF